MKKKVVMSIVLIFLVAFVSTSVTAFSFIDWINNLDFNLITGNTVAICADFGGTCKLRCEGEEHFVGFMDCPEDIGFPGRKTLCCVDPECGDGECLVAGEINECNSCPEDCSLDNCCGNGECDGGIEDTTNCCYDCPCDVDSTEPICNDWPSYCKGCLTNEECLGLEIEGINYCDLETGECIVGEGEYCGDGVCSNEEDQDICCLDCGCPLNFNCNEVFGEFVCEGGLASPACSDEIDNDGDGLIDLADPGCANDPNDEDETMICAITPSVVVDDGSCYSGSKCHDGLLTPQCSECPCLTGYDCIDEICIQDLEALEEITEEVELSCFDADGYCEVDCASGFEDSNSEGLESSCFDIFEEELKCCVPTHQSEKTLEITNTCLDEYHTELGSCSQEKPFYCSSNGNLERDCISCGCPEDQNCNPNDKKECLTLLQEARKSARLSPESKIVISGVVIILGVATLIFVIQHNSQKNIKINKKTRKRRKKKK